MPFGLLSEPMTNILAVLFEFTIRLPFLCINLSVDPKTNLPFLLNHSPVGSLPPQHSVN
jgi:hypothetical protein